MAKCLVKRLFVSCLPTSSLPPFLISHPLLFVTFNLWHFFFSPFFLSTIYGRHPSLVFSFTLSIAFDRPSFSITFFFLSHPPPHMFHSIPFSLRTSLSFSVFCHASFLLFFFFFVTVEYFLCNPFLFCLIFSFLYSV